MPVTEQVSTSYDNFTPLLLEIFESQYLNFGYWTRKNISIPQAQSLLVKQFGNFAKLKRGLEVLDLGCGTGEQDIYFFDRFRCKQIMGMNNSKVQVELALKKRKKRHLGKVDFLLENAENLSRYPKESFNRVLALESSQHFDKKAFLTGAYHLLKPKGYLCIAEIIRKGQRLLHKAKLSEIEEELPIQGGLRSFYKPELKKMRDLIFDSLEIKSVSKIAHQNYNVSYERYLRMLKKAGFLIEEIRDITPQVMGIYSAVRKKAIEMLKAQHPSSKVILYLLVALYLLHCAFARGKTGFYFIRALKGN